jgi:hypothetical protein
MEHRDLIVVAVEIVRVAGRKRGQPGAENVFAGVFVALAHI